MAGPRHSRLGIGRWPVDAVSLAASGYGLSAVSTPTKNEYTITMLSDADAGEIMALQRAAYVTETQAHHDLDLPPPTQTLEE